MTMMNNEHCHTIDDTIRMRHRTTICRVRSMKIVRQIIRMRTMNLRINTRHEHVPLPVRCLVICDSFDSCIILDRGAFHHEQAHRHESRSNYRDEHFNRDQYRPSMSKNVLVRISSLFVSFVRSST
jgi:hypothetical protein